MGKFVLAMYSNQASAQRAIEALLDEHVPPGDLGLFVRSGQRMGKIVLSHETQAWSGAVGGAVVGGLVAATFIIFRLLHAVAGPTMLGSGELTGISILAGLMVGALRGIGRWEQRAVLPTAGIVTVGVKIDAASHDYISRIRAILTRTGGHHVRIYPGMAPEVALRGCDPMAQEGCDPMAQDSVKLVG